MKIFLSTEKMTETRLKTMIEGKDDAILALKGLDIVILWFGVWHQLYTIKEKL